MFSSCSLTSNIIEEKNKNHEVVAITKRKTKYVIFRFHKCGKIKNVTYNMDGELIEKQIEIVKIRKTYSELMFGETLKKKHWLFLNGKKKKKTVTLKY